MFDKSKVLEVMGFIYPIIKTMKTAVDDVILIHDKTIVMISDMCKLSVLELPESTCISICCRFSDIVIASIGEGKNKETWIDKVMYNYDMPLYYWALSTYNKYVTSCTDCLVSIKNFEESYPDICAVRSDSNYVLFSVNGITLSMVPGVIKLNKGDTVSFDLYKGIHEDTYILRFDVYKKKLKNVISIYLSQFNMK